MVPRAPKNRQHGVALVSVLVVVAIATVMAVSIIREQQVSIQTTRGFLQRGQAQQYALGGEELARQILYEDFIEGTGRDHMQETWASDELHFEFEEGEVNLLITDLQGLINLNSLVEGNAQHQAVRQRMINLLGAVTADPALAERLLDWVDEDTSARPAGAEDFEYLGYEPPYRTANTLMTDISEFVLVGVPPEIYMQLAPSITVLPEAGTGLNINTAPPSVLQTLSPTLTYEIAESMAIQRDEQEGFETVEAFLQLPELAGLGIPADGLGVQSSFFEVRVIARYQDRFSYLMSIVQRSATDGSMRVIQRDFSKSFRPQPTGEQADG